MVGTRTERLSGRVLSVRSRSIPVPQPCSPWWMVPNRREGIQRLADDLAQVARRGSSESSQRNDRPGELLQSESVTAWQVFQCRVEFASLDPRPAVLQPLAREFGSTDAPPLVSTRTTILHGFGSVPDCRIRPLATWRQRHPVKTRMRSAGIGVWRGPGRGFGPVRYNPTCLVGSWEDVRRLRQSRRLIVRATAAA